MLITKITRIPEWGKQGKLTPLCERSSHGIRERIFHELSFRYCEKVVVDIIRRMTFITRLLIRGTKLTRFLEISLKYVSLQYLEYEKFSFSFRLIQATFECSNECFLLTSTGCTGFPTLIYQKKFSRNCQKFAQNRTRIKRFIDRNWIRNSLFHKWILSIDESGCVSIRIHQYKMEQKIFCFNGNFIHEPIVKCV